MRTTIVPAQITTVEDKIAGNLTLPQIFLLLLPVFLGGFMYISFPPQLNFAFYKIAILFIMGIVSGTLAIRAKEKMIISWMILLLRFISRPKYFVFNKNDFTQREVIQEEIIQVTQKAKTKAKAKHPKTQHVSIAQALQLEQFIRNPKTNISFRFEKKGGINVSVSEIR